MSALVLGGLVVASLAYLATHGRQHDAEYVERVEKIEREIQIARDKVMFQQF